MGREVAIKELSGSGYSPPNVDTGDDGADDFDFFDDGEARGSLT